MRAPVVFLLVGLTVAADAQVADTCRIWAPRKCGVIVEQATVISRTSPQYPKIARQFRQEAVVQVQIEINERGDVVRATPVDGPEFFRAAAQEAALQWRFRAARINHHAVPSSTILMFRFVLSESS
jgi:TonB family protein